MGVAGWLRAFDTISGLVEVGRRLRGPGQQQGETGLTAAAPPAVFGQLEARLTGVVVAALKEAFDRDRARMDLEREHAEAEHQRAEQALRLELQRQAIDRAVQQLRLLAISALGIWLASAAFVVWLPGFRDVTSRTIAGAGWLTLIASLAVAFWNYGELSSWHGSSAPLAANDPLPPQRERVVSILLIAGLALTAASLIVAIGS